MKNKRKLSILFTAILILMLLLIVFAKTKNNNNDIVTTDTKLFSEIFSASNTPNTSHDNNNKETVTKEIDINAHPINSDRAFVKRVKDGDTIVVEIDEKTVTVRLIGINAPESVSPDESKNCEEGKIVYDFTKNYLISKYVYLEYDKDKTDDYGRTLAYVYLENGEMFNETLLEKGFAVVMNIEPNTKYAAKFKEIENGAKFKKTGFWSTNFWEEYLEN